MNTQKEITDFLNSDTFAVVGVSLSKKKFGNVIFAELKKKGKRVYGVNNKVTSLTGGDIFPDFRSLPEKVEAAVINITPQESLKAVKDAHTNGVMKIWIQQGAQSVEAVQYCQDNGLSVINDRCVLMFSDPEEFPHSFHRWILKIFGKLPV
jgi:predicted CoA-binding protein